MELLSNLVQNNILDLYCYLLIIKHNHNINHITNTRRRVSYQKLRPACKI